MRCATLFPCTVFPLTNQYWHHYWTNAGFPSWSRTYIHIYILSRHWPIWATHQPMPAQYLAIFGIKWMTMHDRIPCLHLSFSWLHTLFLSYSIIISLFFILCYMNILEFHSILYTQLLIPVILLTSTVDVFVCWLESNLGHLFCNANTLPLGYRVLAKVEFLWVLDDNPD